MSIQSCSRRGFLAAMGTASAAPVLPAPSPPAERVPVPKGKVRVVLDTDTYNEIDDQFAVAYSLLSPESMSVEAIYAAPFHNSRSSGPAEGMEKSYDEILRVLNALGYPRSDHVFKGSRSFLPGAGRPVESPAARDLIKRALEGPDEMLYVVPVGAPTNVASAILMEPRLKERITVVWLGGQPYHFPTAREFNLRQDPHASRVLYDSGVRFMNVPTGNVSEQLRTTTAEMEKFLKGKSKIADYLLEIFIEYSRERMKNPAVPWSKVIWDISAVAWLINPDWISSKMVPSPILTDELSWKQDESRHQIRVAMHVNRDAVFQDLFTKLAGAG